MTSEETFRLLYSLYPQTMKFIALVVSSLYICDFKTCREDEYRDFPYFTILSKDSNSSAKHTYADLTVFNTMSKTAYYGRLCMTVNDDLEGENKFSFMLYLKDHEDDKNWKMSIAIPASSIELIKSAQ